MHVLYKTNKVQSDIGCHCLVLVHVKEAKAWHLDTEAMLQAHFTSLAVSRKRSSPHQICAERLLIMLH